MAGRIRSIKPEILEDDKTAALSDSAWRVFVSSFLLADDHGNFRASPALVDGHIFWASRKPRESVANILGTLARVGLITLYQVRGQPYAKINGWPKHQKVDKPGAPRMPRCEDGVLIGDFESFVDDSRAIRELVANDSRLIHDPDPDLRSRSPIPDPFTAGVQKPKRRKQSAMAAPSAVAVVRALWLKCYEAKYGKRYPWGAREGGQCSVLLGSWPLEELQELVPLYFAWARPEVIRSGHPFGVGMWCFTMRLHELRADVIDPKRRAIAAQVGKRERNDNEQAEQQDQAARVAARMEAKRGQQGIDRTGADASRGTQPPAIGSGARDVGRGSSGVPPGDRGVGDQGGVSGADVPGARMGDRSRDGDPET